MTSPGETTASSAVSCPECGSHIAAALRSCPSCHRLVHAARLKELADTASSAARAGDVQSEVAAWRASLELLPPQSRQFAAISERLTTISKSSDAAAAAQPPSSSSTLWKWLIALGPIGLLLWKFKFVVLALATKGKLLLLGLTKSGTVFTMLLSLGVYWTAWGLPFAFGLVISIYIHEMGHVAALRRYGIPATAPMFIPGFGALIRSKQPPASAYEDARVGLAGPWWGLGAAVAAYAGSVLGGGALWMAIAKVGAWINLLNLIPIWPLDGGRGFTALTREHRWTAVASLGAGWIITRDGLFMLLLIVAIGRALGSAPSTPDRGAMF
jgi:Zn-dependent protease